MSEERKGQVAVLLLKDHILEQGFTISSQSRRNLGNVAKRIGVPLDELLEFARPLLQEALEASLAAQKK
ncbi:MAG: hypothetical protein Q7S48_02820 [bacterium]|nr:hypothetical protein [bacterium]